ncbi:heme/hemin ABC transporter substrate-binding protein [Bordetella sp. 2513F-2]
MKYLLAFFLSACAAWHGAASAQSRVVTLGGSVTEIVYALDEGSRLVGDDLSSLYPEAATRLPRVGYYRAVPVEGVLALRPDLVLASEQAGPPETLRKLGKAGVRVETVSDQPSVQSLQTRIAQVARALGAEAAGRALSDTVMRDLDAARALPASNARAMLLMNRTGTLQGAGAGTAAGLVLELAGLRNVLDGQQGYKPVSAEALAGLAPEVIVITRTSLEASGGMDALRAMPGLAATPAGAHDCIVVMDDLLALGTGPRLPQAIRTLKETACVASPGPRRTPA